MPVVDYGIGKLGSFLAGLAPSTYVGSIAFGVGSASISGSNINLSTEVIRVPVTWSLLTGSDFQCEGTLNTLQANGSYLQELGLVFGASANGSDLFTRNLSSIGSKNNSFSVVVTQTVRIRRF